LYLNNLSRTTIEVAGTVRVNISKNRYELCPPPFIPELQLSECRFNQREMNKFSLVLLAGLVGIVSIAQAEQLAMPDLQATYQSIHDNIFVPKCMTCHSVGNSAEDTPLEPYSALLALKGVVVPGNSAASSLYVLTADGKMPKKNSGIAPLDAIEVSSIQSWIDSGAGGP
jgi:hypothetical protein